MRRLRSREVKYLAWGSTASECWSRYLSLGSRLQRPCSYCSLASSAEEVGVIFIWGAGEKVNKDSTETLSWAFKVLRDRVGRAFSVEAAVYAKAWRSAAMPDWGTPYNSLQSFQATDVGQPCVYLLPEKLEQVRTGRYHCPVSRWSQPKLPSKRVAVAPEKCHMFMSMWGKSLWAQDSRKGKMAPCFVALSALGRLTLLCPCP